MSLHKNNRQGLFSNLKYDLPASIVVFFVALPLCLGIALASGAPLLSGLISGIVGGVIAGALSASSLGVSGPAAGLAVIVMAAISDLGSFEGFLVAGVLAGLFQIIFSIVKAGKVAQLFPSSVIKGMLVGIGIIIFLKQIPHLFGYDADVEGDFAYSQIDGETTFSEISKLFGQLNIGVIVISVISLAILIVWQFKFIQKNKILSLIPGPLIVVVLGILIGMGLDSSTLKIGESHFVNIPEIKGWEGLKSHLSFPDWTFLYKKETWIVAITISVVASIETLLCLDATDKIDPYHKKITPANRELFAQGISNVVACFIGGIPITQVIVRSSANIQAGGRSKLSAILHGILLAICVLSIPFILNMVPIATLAAVLTIVGYKLAKPILFVDMFKKGMIQFTPFIATVGFMLFTDLLTGVMVGFIIATLFVLYNTYKTSIAVNKKSIAIIEKVKNNQSFIYIKLINNVTFFSKIKLISRLNNIPKKSTVEIDIRGAKSIHPDVEDLLKDFEIQAVHKRISYTLNK